MRTRRPYAEPEYQRRKRQYSPADLTAGPLAHPGAYHPAPTLEELRALTASLPPACVKCLFYKCDGPGSPGHRITGGRQ